VSFARQGAGTVLARVIVYAAIFAANILIARYLGPAGKGQIAILVFTITVVVNLAALGVPAALSYYIGRRIGEPQKMLGASIPLFAATLIVFGVPYLVALPWLRLNFFTDMPAWLPLAAILAFPLTLWTNYAIYVFVGMGRIRLYNLLEITDRVSYLLFQALILVAVSRTVAGVIYAEILGRGLACALACWLIWKLARPVLKFSVPEMKQLLNYGLRAQIITIATIITFRVGLYILRYYRDDATVGQYAMALNVAEILLFIPNSFGVVLFSRTASTTDEEANRFTPVATRNVLFVTAVSAALLALAAPILVPAIFGKAFAPSLAPFMVLLPGVVIFTIYRVLSYDLMARGMPLRVSLAAGAGLIANVITGLILVPGMGAMGAAWGNFAGYAATSIIVLAQYLYVSKTPLLELLVFKPSDIRFYTRLLNRRRET
jgi:O-antigen/teichoic acid export membrane protein